MWGTEHDLEMCFELCEINHGECILKIFSCPFITDKRGNEMLMDCDVNLNECHKSCRAAFGKSGKLGIH